MTSFTMPFNFTGHTGYPLANQQGYIPQYFNHVTDKKPIVQKSSVNQLGGVFTNGKPLPDSIRHEIIQMSLQGVKSCEISKQLKVSHGCISKILSRYHATGSLKPSSTGGSKPKVATDEVKSAIVELKKNNPDMFAREVLENVINRGLCSKENAPSISSVNRILRKFSLGNNRTTNSESLFQISPFSNERPNCPNYQGSMQQTINSTSLGNGTLYRPFIGVKRKAEDDNNEGNPQKIQKTSTDYTLLNGVYTPTTGQKAENIRIPVNNDNTGSSKVVVCTDNSLQCIANAKHGDVMKTKPITSTLGKTEPWSENTDVQLNQTKPKDDFHTKIQKLQPNGFPYFHPAMGWMNLIPISYETMADLGLPTSLMSNSANSIFYDGPTIPGTSSTQTESNSVQQGTEVMQKRLFVEKQRKAENLNKSSGNIFPLVEFSEQNMVMKSMETINVKMSESKHIENVPMDIKNGIFQTSEVITKTSFNALTNSCQVAKPSHEEFTDDSFSDDSFSERLTIHCREECHESVVAVDYESEVAANHESVLAVDLSDVLREELEDSCSSFDDSSDVINVLNTPSSPPFEQMIADPKVKKELFPLT